MAITLLIDNSNTRTKLALSYAGKLMDWRETLATASLTPATLLDAISEQAFTRACICSVVPDKAKILADTLTAMGIPCHQVSHQSKLPVAIDYPNPRQIGPDRLANAAALAPLTTSAIVIDFGTAVTFDVLSSREGGTYLGGVIAPGLGALCHDLHQRTALLPRIELAEPESAIGKSTEHAMQVGAVIGYRGLIREILKALAEELPTPPVIHATGGDAPLIAARMPEIEIVDANLTLRGIQKIGELNLDNDL